MARPGAVDLEHALAVAAADLGRIAEQPVDRSKLWTPHPHQIPPEDWGATFADYYREADPEAFDRLITRIGVDADDPIYRYFAADAPVADWSIWLLKGGRGAGKTDAGAHYCLRYLRELGSKARVYVGSPTRDDVRDTCAEGPSGLITIAKDEFDWHRSDRQAFHKDGGYVRFLGSEEPGRWNGPGFGLLWADELWDWNPESWNQAQFCLRETDRPRALVTTTPKRSALVKKLEKLPGTVTVHATSHDNTALSPRVIAQLEAMFGKGTRIARMEMLAEEPADVEGSLVKYEWIEDRRRKTVSPEDMQKMVVAIDPAGSQRKAAAHTGLCVAGYGYDLEYYVFEGRADAWSPDGWAKQAIRLWVKYRADKLIAETNYGGDMVEATLRNAWNDRQFAAELGLFGELPFERVTAARGKAVRADPIAALYEQGVVHHVGVFTELEDQWTSFTGDVDAMERMDLIDANVWALTYLSGQAGGLVALLYGSARGW